MSSKHIVIIGGGPAGLEASASLANLGHQVTLIEKEEKLGGKLNQWYSLFPDKRPANEVLKGLLAEIENKNVEVLTNTNVKEIEKVKNYYSIHFEDKPSLIANAVLLTTGYDLFDVTQKEEYGYGIYPGVITNGELETMFNQNAVVNAKGQVPKRVILLHCVGSRDEKAGNQYCSKVCCVTAVKQAIEIKKRYPETEVFCFYMDIRMFGPNYEELYREAQEKWEVVFVRGKISEAAANFEGNIQVKAEDTLAGKPLRMSCDLLVLMAGMVPAEASTGLINNLKLEKGSNRFVKSLDNHLKYNETNQDGIFTAGCVTSPMNITDTITNARAAALSIHQYINN
jgi:heterodisulfide reductase subunit A